MRITRPINPYSPDWAFYNAQNPHLPRSVGADAAEEGKEPTVEELQTQLAAEAAAQKAQTAQITKLTEELESFKTKHHESEKHKKEQEKKAKDALEEAARKSGDIQALEDSWKEKYSSLESSSNETVQSLNSIINDITVVAAAKSIAAKLALKGSEEVLIPHITSRLTSDIEDGKSILKVIKEGKPSALTLEDLEAEISGTAAFAPVLRGSGADGAGGAGNASGESGSHTMKRDKFEALSPKEQQDFWKADGAKLID